jgi:hypothetical protein
MEKSFFTIDIIFFVGNISRYIWCIELLQVIIFFFLYNKMANLFSFRNEKSGDAHCPSINKSRRIMGAGK